MSCEISAMFTYTVHLLNVIRAWKLKLIVRNKTARILKKLFRKIDGGGNFLVKLIKYSF